MIIRRIELENIRSHLNSEIKFTPGINVITGNTGSGKSSILMGIEYALFGNIGEGREGSRLLLRRGSEYGSVSIELLSAGNEFSISRGLKRSKDVVKNDDSGNMIKRDGVKLDMQDRATDINAYVSRLLKIESDAPIKTFEAITYIKQDELKGLIFETGQTKQEYIDRLLQLNKYADIYSVLKDVVSEITTGLELKNKEISLSGDENELIKIKKEISDVSDIKNSLNKKTEELTNELNNEKRIKSDLESEIKFYRDLKSRYDSLSASVNDKIKQKDTALKQLSEIEAKIKKISAETVRFDEESEKALKNEVTKLEEELDKKSIESKELYKMLYSAEEKHKETRQILEKTNQEAKDLENEKSSLVEKRAALIHELEQNKEFIAEEEMVGRVAQLKDIISEISEEEKTVLEVKICPICGAKIESADHVKSEYSKLREKYSKRIEDIRSAAVASGKKTKKELEREVDSISLQIKDVEKKLDENSRILSSIEPKTQENDYLDAKSRYENSLSAESKLKEQLKSVKTELSGLDEAKKLSHEIDIETARLSTIQNSLSLIDKEISELKSSLDKLGFKQDDLESREKKLDSSNQTLSSLSSELSKTQRELELRDNQTKELESRLKEIELKLLRKQDLIKEAEKETEFLKIVSNLREDIRDIREYVRNKFINDFRALFQQRFNEIRNESDYVVDIDNNYNVTVLINGETNDARTLSGGEKTSVALAYRMALSSIASMLGGVGENELLIMDEPTSGLDREDINSLTNAITKLVDIKQIIIVTHEDNMKNIADNLISIRKESGKSIISYSG
ncbi:MAG: SMC family ATPase [Candidatus Parvarchaeota archaeon]|nr:SMC family ATPase [Candidatus Parvarchaeota archaeon]